jgi:hypothetical protein
MLCSQCSTLNPDNNRFCGECGQPLIFVQQPVAVSYGETRQEESPPPFEPSHQTTISGPSFLGLTDSSDEDDATSYLLQDERPRSGHFGWFLFSVIAVAVLAVIGWMEWKAIQTGKLPVPGLQTTSAGPAPQQTPPSPGGLATADQKAESEGAGEEASKSVSADGTKDEKPEAAPSTSAASESEAKKSDAQATQESESRIAKEADARKQQEATEDSSESESAPRKPAAKPVSVSTTKPDPRKNQMLLSGEKYLYGRGVRQDCNQALVYFRSAAQDQNGPAMSHLGAMYASGHCVTANRVAAYKWFARAAEQEPANQWISRSLNMLWRDMTPQERASVGR